MVRDPITLRFIIALPIMQLFLFGYAINTNPKDLPAGLLSVEHSKYERTIIAALRTTGYYNISILASEAEAERGLARGDLLFVINIPPNFDRSIDRGETPPSSTPTPAIPPPLPMRRPRFRPWRWSSIGTCRRFARRSLRRHRSSSWSMPAIIQSN